MVGKFEMPLFIIIISAIVFHSAWSENATITFMLFHEKEQRNIVRWFEDGLKAMEESSEKLDVYPIELQEENNELQEKVCQGLHRGSNVAIDISWITTEDVENAVGLVNIPYVKVDVTIGPFLELLDKYLDQRNATDVALLFDDSKRAEESLYYWINTEKTKLIIMDTLDETSAQRLKSLRPMPNFYALISTTQNALSLLKLATQTDLAKLTERWNLVLLDFNTPEEEDLLPYNSMSILQLDTKICCSLLKTPNCICPPDFILQKHFLISILRMVKNVIERLQNKGIYPTIFSCNSTTSNEDAFLIFKDSLAFEVQQDDNMLERDGELRLPVRGNIEVVMKTAVEKIGSYDENNGVLLETGKNIVEVKPYYRIGITHAIPWAFKQLNEQTGERYWTGYCVDFAQKLSELMDFKYELVEPETGTFGSKASDGNWNGIVGDLQRGNTDLAIAALTMTADREEVIDFVAPYFDQSGISIVMRKPVRKTSLFKFMTVLKLEVWLSIVAALTITGFLIWCLDKYSPYSGQNNKDKYPYPCREFTLKESFWFALTSFTPQGGGEAPKSLSGRALVAAYWLFVVLMLATFTANLAAFLTVERMQTPVQSLDQLAKQSRINYTVVESSDTHEYFINMKNAEDTLYRLWKELTLNASTDGTQYRVWDYPIREQYGHILLAINDSNPVKDAAEGFRKVNEFLDADFAFIHDSAEIKYEISKNCNLTEVGEIFAEKPYAVAVQQGSHLTDTLSKQILNLQKERFFDYLQSKYWNNSLKANCADADDNEGITLESLGGVFIATLFGLALAMMTLAGEVIYYKRKKKSKAKVIPKVTKVVEQIKTITVNPKGNTITFGNTFKSNDKRNVRLSPTTLQWNQMDFPKDGKK